MNNDKFEGKSKDYQNNGKNGKGRRNPKRGNNKRDKDDFRNPKEQYSEGGIYVNRTAGSENDFSWYNQLPQLTEDATKVSFFNQLGAETDIFSIDPLVRQSAAKSVPTVLPGIMALNTVITPGTCRNARDPMNIAAINLYEYVRKALNKPNPDYEASDLLIMLFCTMNVYALYANILRAFGIVSQWNMTNLYTPKSLMKAAYGWTDSSFNACISQYANYLARFNQLIYKASSLYLPTSFKLMDRYAWLFSNIFRDHHRQKAQYYIHRMSNFYEWDETTYDTGSAAKYMPFNSYTMAAMLDIFDHAIEQLRNSTSIRIMQSDLRKAFEDKQAWSLAYADDRYTTPIVDSDEVLMQIENATYFREWNLLTERERDVVQDVNQNCIVFNPKYRFGSDDISETPLPAMKKPTINVHNESPSAEDIMVATRQILACTLEPVPETEDNVDMDCYFASDFITNASIFYSPTSDPVAVKPVIVIDDDAVYEADLRYLSLGQSFDWAPTTLVVSSRSTELITWGSTTEWDNYTVLSTDMVERLHVVAMLSMWYISEFGEWNSL